MKYIITLALLLLSQKTISQVYLMTPIVITGNGGTAIGGMPIVMDSRTKCLTTSIGISTLLAPSQNKRGEFNETCKEIVPIATLLSLNLYPNPTHSTSILRLSGQFDVSLSCSITISTYDGKVLNSQMVPLFQVQSGYLINLTNYPPSTYIISLGYKDQYYSLKLIKTL